MEKREIGFRSLFPANQNAAESVHPTVCTLDDPASGTKAGFLFNRDSLFASGTDMRGKAKLSDQRPHFLIVIAFIQAKSLRKYRCRHWPVQLQIRQGRPHQLHVMAVCAVNDNSQRNAMGLSEQTALDPAFAAIRRIGPDFFPRPKALWSWHRPVITRSSQFPPTRLPPAVPGARILRIRPHQAIREIAGKPTCSNRYQWRSGHSTGSRSGARKRWHSLPPDPGRADCDSPADAASEGVTAVPFVPTIHPVIAIHRPA